MATIPEKKTIFVKIKELFGSLRFWLIVGFAIAFVSGHSQDIYTALKEATEIITILTALTRTIDKFR
jgi:hypothetical protein